MNKSRSSYYITCLMSGMIELGSVFWGLKNGWSITAVLGLATAYQTGNLLRFFVNRKISKIQDLLSALTVVISITLLLLDNSTTAAYILAIVWFSLFSTILQNERSAVQGAIPRWQKRSCRVLGFVSSALVFYAGAILLFAASCLLLFFSTQLDHFFYDNWLANWRSGTYGKRICWPMVTHQAHYFSYNYVMLIIVMQRYQNALVAVLWFAANWIPYTITEPLVQKLKWNKWYAIAISAHLFNSAVLLGMFIYLEKNIAVALCLWVLTGFGGGNVFCIRKALRVRVEYNKDVWNFSEQVGHILGCTACIAIIYMGIAPKYTLLAAVGFALITVPVIIYTVHRG